MIFPLGWEDDPAIFDCIESAQYLEKKQLLRPFLHLLAPLFLMKFIVASMEHYRDAKIIRHSGDTTGLAITHRGRTVHVRHLGRFITFTLWCNCVLALYLGLDLPMGVVDRLPRDPMANYGCPIL